MIEEAGSEPRCPGNEGGTEWGRSAHVQMPLGGRGLACKELRKARKLARTRKTHMSLLCSPERLKISPKTKRFPLVSVNRGDR